MQRGASSEKHEQHRRDFFCGVLCVVAAIVDGGCRSHGVELNNFVDVCSRLKWKFSRRLTEIHGGEVVVVV